MMSKKQKHASELMPKSEEALTILTKRAQQFAQQEINELEHHGIPFVRFKLGQNENYGVAYHYVQEVLHHVSITKPPFIPYYIAGVINWRGAVITIVDLIKFFHPNNERKTSEPTKDFIIVIHAQNINLGFRVHYVEGGEFYQENQLSSPLSSLNIAKPEYILGLHHTITAIINVEAFITGLIKEIKDDLFKIGDVHGIC